jgi:hypothetical protein
MIINEDSISEKTKQAIRGASHDLLTKTEMKYRKAKRLMLCILLLMIIIGSALTIMGKQTGSLWGMIIIGFIGFLAMLDEERVKCDLIKLAITPSLMDEIKNKKLD